MILSYNFYPFIIIMNVPIVMNTPPRIVLGVGVSRNTTKASIIVITTLNLSTGTTFEASPICNAL